MAVEPAPGPEEGDPARPVVFGLPGRLLVLTIAFVMLAEVLIYVPSVANFRRTWLNDRLAAAQIAALVIEAAPEAALSSDLQNRLLDGVGAHAVAVRGRGARRLLARDGMPPAVDRVVDLRDARWQGLIRDAFATLLAPSRGPIRVVGPGMGGGAGGGADLVEIVIDEEPLREAMIAFSGNILLLSLLISAITAALIFVALDRLIVRPVRHLARNVAAFAENPDDAARIITPSGRTDEIGLAERALARMEARLAGTLRQSRRLAALGLAVSKVNHELRNLLTTGQLLTDRLGEIEDPAAARVAPRLVATLRRAIAFCEATLAYGRAAEPPPRRRRIALAPLAEELTDLAGLAPEAGIRIDLDIPPDLTVDADPDQLARALANLVRNAVQALARGAAREAALGAPVVRVEARRTGSAVEIRVADNGPGVPERARQHLFTAFQGSVNAGGTGLGLAIAAELVALHGGTLVLETAEGPGACFRLTLPDAPAP